MDLVFCLVNNDKVLSISPDGGLVENPILANKVVVAAYVFQDGTDVSSVLSVFLKDAIDWVAFPFAIVGVAGLVLDDSGEIIDFDFLNRDLAVLLLLEKFTYLSILEKGSVKDKIIVIDSNKITDESLPKWKGRIGEKVDGEDAVVVINNDTIGYKQLALGLSRLFNRQDKP